MRPRYAWTDLPFGILAVLMLIPLAMHLVQIISDFLADLP